MRPFADRLLPAPVGRGFAMDDWWVWCGSVIRGGDGRYHMFAARWPRELPFFKGYQTHSEVVRAESATPEGPYEFREVVLPERGAQFWDGRMTHNPTVRYWRGRYLLFYIGATYEGERPTAAELLGGSRKPNESYASIRIGIATAESVTGPWQRRDEPVLVPRPGKWDGSVVTNPAPVLLEDGRIQIIYRSNTPAGLRLGVAAAAAVDDEFVRLRDEPVLELPGGNCVEDPFVWWQDGCYQMLAKDITGGITGEKHAGVHAFSNNALDWTLAPVPKAYSRRVRWSDGRETVQGCLERPQLLLADGVPTHLFAATGDGPGGFHEANRTWNMVIPLAT